MTLERLITTFIYIGKIPFAPGTCGSLVAAIIWFFIPINYLIQLLIIVILFFIGLYASKVVAFNLKNSDPSEIVIDEVIGMWIALFMIPHNIKLFIIAFLIFRFFDIIKPSFIFHIQKFSRGWGIMLDDIIAGLFTLLIIIGIGSIS